MVGALDRLPTKGLTSGESVGVAERQHLGAFEALKLAGVGRGKLRPVIYTCLRQQTSSLPSALPTPIASFIKEGPVGKVGV